MTTPVSQPKRELPQVDFASFRIDPTKFMRPYEDLVASAIKDSDVLTPTIEINRDDDEEGER